jgi:hypothetical protein
MPDQSKQQSELPSKMPLPVKEQSDPLLQTSTGRMGAGGLSLILLAVVIIMSLVFYGLNGPNSGSSSAPASATSAPATPQDAGVSSGAGSPAAPVNGPHNPG